MNKKHLYCIAAALWGIPGIIITFKGIRAYWPVSFSCSSALSTGTQSEYPPFRKITQYGKLFRFEDGY
jgi:hypothetical protein